MTKYLLFSHNYVKVNKFDNKMGNISFYSSRILLLYYPTLLNFDTFKGNIFNFNKFLGNHYNFSLYFVKLRFFLSFFDEFLPY